MAIIKGVPGDDELTGTAFDDTFQLAQISDFSAQGLEGDDRFAFRGSFTAADKVDGGSGRDVIVLEGNYIGPNAVTFAADTMVGVEVITLLGATAQYDLTTDDANVAAGQTLVIQASAVGSALGLTFDGSAETDGRFEIYGTAGNDTLTGGAGDDLLGLGSNGVETAQGGAGDDRFLLGGLFDSADSIDGGLDHDVAILGGGDYTGATALDFAATTLVGVEELILSRGFSYDLATHDATVAAGQRLEVNASKLQAANTLTFDGSAETDGAFTVTGGAGDDTLTGGAGNDIFWLGRGGIDHAAGGDGNDVFNFGATLVQEEDSIDGGDGNDRVTLNGDYSTGTFLSALTMTNVETLKLGSGHGYSLTFDNSAVAAGETLTVDGSALGAGDALLLDGSFVFDGSVVFIGGAGADDFTGGAGADVLTGGDGGNVLKGGGGADSLTCGAGDDAIDYFGASQSTSTMHDSIADFDAALDRFELGFIVDAVVARSGSIDSSSFDSDIGTAVNDGVTAGDAVIITATGGDLIGHTFLVGMANGDGVYDAGGDYVIDITGFTGTITTSNF